MMERIDKNHVDVSGTVIKIWKRNANFFARMVTTPKEASIYPPRLNLKIPLEKFNGDSISLMAGDHLKVSGWIGDEPYFESLREFVSRTKYPIRLDAHLDLDRFGNLGVKRSITVIVPEVVEPVSDPIALNLAIVEGTVVRTWEHKENKYVRLAIYHSKPSSTEAEKANDRQRQIPHYVSVQFPGGCVDQRSIHLFSKQRPDGEVGIAPHDRLVVFGDIAESYYSESLHSFLVDARRIDVLNEIPDSSEAANIWSSYSQTVITARKIIHYT